MKIFGKQLFKKGKETMYDFAQHGLLNSKDQAEMAYFSYATAALTPADKKKQKALEKKTKKSEISPKDLYKLNALNDNNFKIKTDSKYIRKEIKNIEQKLDLIYPNGDESNGLVRLSGGGEYSKLELVSVVRRLKARLKIKTGKFDSILEDYPHTSSALINDVVSQHANLRCKVATEFVSDMPDDAVEAMTRYNDMCQELVGLKTHFYVIADKKDFGEIDRKRDPILLAQSPFGFFWQILGAWDEEMIYLGDL